LLIASSTALVASEYSELVRVHLYDFDGALGLYGDAAGSLISSEPSWPRSSVLLLGELHWSDDPDLYGIGFSGITTEGKTECTPVNSPKTLDRFDVSSQKIVGKILFAKHSRTAGQEDQESFLITLTSRRLSPLTNAMSVLF
jgi:hypothetical protein